MFFSQFLSYYFGFCGLGKWTSNHCLAFTSYRLRSSASFIFSFQLDLCRFHVFFTISFLFPSLASHLFELLGEEITSKMCLQRGLNKKFHTNSQHLISPFWDGCPNSKSNYDEVSDHDRAWMMLTVYVCVGNSFLGFMQTAIRRRKYKIKTSIFFVWPKLYVIYNFLFHQRLSL